MKKLCRRFLLPYAGWGFIVLLFPLGMIVGRATVTAEEARAIVLTDVRDHNKFSAELATAMGMKQPDFLDTLEGVKK